MKREIKFRGKRLDNGEWVYGFVVQWATGTVVIVNTATTIYQSFPVDPETVGQCTNILDEMQVSIYEDDICRVPMGTITVCQWSMDGAFHLRGKGPGATFAVRFTDSTSGEAKRPVVIGNIHDNPELL